MPQFRSFMQQAARRLSLPRGARLYPLALLVVASANALPSDITLDETPNYEDHITEIMRDACTSCHRGSRARNGLQLTSLAKILEGGSGGAALIPGDAAGSLMYQLMMHEREPFMPEDEDKLDADTLALVRDWIDAGAPATATSGPSAGMALTSGPAMNLTAISTVGAVAAIPSGLRLTPLWWSARGGAVMAVAASPSVNLVALGGHKQVSLYDPTNGKLLGMLAFSEGDVKSLRFSRNGALLIAAGGRGGATGRVVGWDVATGERLFEMGDEPDSILSADLSSDHTLLALGGIDGVLRVFSTDTGAELYKSTKHTDWITAVAFSPDGVLLCSADRAGGLFVWEAMTGREFHILEGQKGAVNALAWRADSMVLASGANDGALRLFEMQNGKRVKGWTSHGGVLGLDFLPDGKLLSSGRDARARLWDGNGKELKNFSGASQLATSCAATFDGKLLLVGDMQGVVRVHEHGKSDALRTLHANPRTIKETAAHTARAAFNAREKIVANLSAAQSAQEKELAPVRKELDALTKKSADAEKQMTTASAAQTATATQVEQAKASRVPAQGSLKTASKLLEKLTAELATATTAATACSETAKTAAKEQVSAQRAVQVAGDENQRNATEAAFKVADEQLTSALARAQSTATTAAELTLRQTNARIQKELWDGITAPLAAKAKELKQAERQAAKEAQRREKEAAAAKAAVQPVAKKLAGMQAELAKIKPGLTAAIAERDGLRALVASVEKTWNELKAVIEAAGGRVEAEEQ